MNELAAKKQQGQMFKAYHLLIFKGVYLFHQQRFEEAFQSFAVAQSQKEVEITEKSAKGREMSEEEEDADLLEVLEIKFNELACLVMLRQFKKAKERCRQLIENINEGKQEGLQYLLVQLDNEMKKGDGRSYSKGSVAYRLDELVGYDNVICLYDEPKENPICFQVPIVFVDYMDDLKLRLSFSLPKVTPPSLQTQFDRALIEDVGPLSIENKPEAPWIRRESQNEMIMFTDNIQMIEDIRLETEQDEDSSRKDSQAAHPKAADPKAEFKNQLMLDKHIEEKLQKLLEKKHRK